MNTIDLTPRLRAAADFMESAGWTQGTDRDDDGRVCLTGAIRYCAPQTGDEHLIRVVLRKHDRAEDWNDTRGRDAAEVVEYLRTAEVTDRDLADTFGPQWEHIVALVRRAATLTEAEARDLRTAYDATAADATYAAYNAAYAATAAYAAYAATAAYNATYAAAAYDATAADDAYADYVALALATRHLIGTHGYTQTHYDTLTTTWRRAIGPIHPDDQDLPA